MSKLCFVSRKPSIHRKATVNPNHSLSEPGGQGSETGEASQGFAVTPEPGTCPFRPFHLVPGMRFPINTTSVYLASHWGNLIANPHSLFLDSLRSESLATVPF